MDFNAEMHGSVVQRAMAAELLATARDTTEMTLYRYYDAEGVLLYLGVTNNMKLRHMQHRNRSPWFPKVSTRTEETVTGRWAAFRKEERAIKSEKPLFNKHHNGGRNA